MSGSGRNSVKAPGEKLLRVSLDEEGGLVRRVSLSGDFFAYPEEGLRYIEKSLEGLPVKEDVLLEAIRITLRERGIELLGISAETIARAVAGARGA